MRTAEALTLPNTTLPCANARTQKYSAGHRNAAISSTQKDGTLDKASTLGMIVQLTELNKEPEANKNALEKLISGFGRSFGTVEAFNFPGEALGYSEKPGSTTTAGKALD